MPDAPALAVINASSSPIQEPGSLQQFGAALVNGFTPQGGIQSGLALELTGHALGFGRNWVDYKNSYFTRLMARMSLSVGTSQSAGTTTATSSTTSSTAASAPPTLLGVGLRIVLVDGTDGLLNAYLMQKVTDIDYTCGCLPMGSPEFRQCKAQVLSDLGPPKPPDWNASGASIAAATSGAFAGGALSSGSWADSAVWVTGTLGVSDWLQLSAAAQYKRIAGTSQDVGTGALRVRGGNGTLRGSIEGAYATANPYDVDNRKGRLLFGLDIKLMTGTWLTANIGGDYNFTDSPVGLLTLANLRYSFAGTPSTPGAND